MIKVIVLIFFLAPVYLYSQVDRFAMRDMQTSKYGVWEVINGEGKYVIEPKYDGLSVVTQTVFTVKTNGKWGVIDDKENYIVKPTYDVFSFFQDYSNKITSLVFGVKTECAGNMTKYDEDGKICCFLWGIITMKGNVVVKPQYFDRRFFAGEGYALKDSQGHWTVFNNEGKVIVEYKDKVDNLGDWFRPDEETGEIYHNWYIKNGLYGLLSQNGKILTEPLYLEPFKCYGGEMEEPMYWEPDAIIEVNRDGKVGFINMEGKEVIPAIYQNFAGRFGFDRDELQSEDAKYFVTLIPAKLNGKWGFIDSAGKVVIDFKYFEAYGFDNTMVKQNQKPLAQVVLNDENLTEGYIDKNGNFSAKKEDLQKSIK